MICTHEDEKLADCLTYLGNMSTSFRTHDRSRLLIHVDPVPVHVSAYVTGGLESLYKRINGQEATKTCGYGHFTDSNGYFDPKDDCCMALRYQVLGQLGHGQSSVLVKAKDLFCHNQLVAIKVLHRHYYNLGAQETHCMQLLNNADPHQYAHVIRLHTTFVFDDHFCMVFELLEPKPLTQMFCRLEKCQVLTSIRKVAWKLLQVVGFLQKENVIHADLKPENILLQNDNDVGSLRVADFGNAIHCVHNEVSLYYQDFELQTLLYRAPEVLFGLPFSVEIDMWSLGCILAELYLGRPLFYGTDKLKVLAKMYRVLGPMPSDVFCRAKFYSKLQAYCAAGSQRDATRFLMISYGMETSFASFLAGLLRFNPSEFRRMRNQLTVTVIHNWLLKSGFPRCLGIPSAKICTSPDERLTPFQAAQHPFLATESGFCFLLPKSIVGNEAYPRIPLSNSEYQERPLVDDNVRRQHMSSLDLLAHGTSYAPHEVFAASKRNVESSHLFMKQQRKVTETQDKHSRQHSHWYRREEDDQRNIAPQIKKPKPIFGLNPKDMGLDSKEQQESLKLESKLCPIKKNEEHIKILNISSLHGNREQETETPACGSSVNVETLSPIAKDGNVYYTENKIYIISGRQNILELHESQVNGQSNPGQDRSTTICTKSAKKTNHQDNDCHMEGRYRHSVTSKENIHQKSDSADIMNCPTAVQFKEDSFRYHVINAMSKDITKPPSSENYLPIVKSKNENSINKTAKRERDVSAYCKSPRADKDTIVENVACTSTLIAEKKISINTTDSLNVKSNSKLPLSSDFSHSHEFYGLPLDNNDSNAHSSRREHLDLQKIPKTIIHTTDENCSDIEIKEVPEVQVSSNHTAFNHNTEGCGSEIYMKQDKDGSSSADEDIKCRSKKRLETVIDKHSKQNEPSIMEEIISDISDYSDADEFKYQQISDHSLRRCESNAKPMNSRRSVKNNERKNLDNVDGPQIGDQKYSSSDGDHVETCKARKPRLCKENNHERCKTSPFRIDAWNYANDDREKKKKSDARKSRHNNECVTPDEKYPTKHRQKNEDPKSPELHDRQMDTSNKCTTNQKDLQSLVNSVEERSAIKNDNGEQLKTPNKKNGKNMLTPDTGKTKPKKKGQDMPNNITVKKNKYEKRVKVLTSKNIVKSQKKKKKKHHKRRSPSCEKTPDHLRKRTPSKSQSFKRKESFDNRVFNEERTSSNLEGIESRVQDGIRLHEMTEKGRREQHWSDLRIPSEFAKYENIDPYLSDVAEPRPRLNKDLRIHSNLKKRKSPQMHKSKSNCVEDLHESDLQSSAKLTRINSYCSKMSNATHIERNTNNPVKICKEVSERRKSEKYDLPNAKYDKNRCSFSKTVEWHPNVSVYNFVGTPVKKPPKSPLKPVKGENGQFRNSADKSHGGQCVHDRYASPDLMLKTETSCKNKIAVNDTKSKSKVKQRKESQVNSTRHGKSVNQQQKISTQTFLSEKEQNCPKQDRAQGRPKGRSPSTESEKRSDVLNLGKKSPHLANDNITEMSATVAPKKQHLFKEPIKTSLSNNKVPLKNDLFSSDEFSLYSDDFDNTHSQQSDDGCTPFDSTLLYAPGGSCSIVKCNTIYESSKKRKHSDSILNSGFREHVDPVLEKRRKIVNPSPQRHERLQMGTSLKLLKQWRFDSEFDDEVLLLPE